MTDSNPFEVPEFLNGAALPFRVAVDPHWFRVDGKLLVCGQSVILPKICYKTGAETDLVQETIVALYPTLKIVTELRQCTVEYSMAPTVARRLQLRATFGFLAVIVGIIVTVAGDQLFPIDFGTGFLAGGLMIVSGLVDRLFLKPGLRLVRYEAPGYYFVRGFSSTFLARLAEFAEKSDVAQLPINRFPEMPFIERPGK